jgi:beta-lactamase superfamily II metal-dependent hydrolase
MTRTSTEFHLLPAFHGDSVLIKTFDENSNEFIILVDGGTAQTFRYTLKQELEGISRINILILTHIDSDHIGGLLSFFKSSLMDTVIIDEIWINHPELVEINKGELISVKQADNLKNLIAEKKPESKLFQIVASCQIMNRSGLNFTFLSPTREVISELYCKWETGALQESQGTKVDISSNIKTYSQSLEELNRISFAPNKSIVNDIYNASSIAFLLSCPDTSLLMLGDSRPEVISQELKKHGYSEKNPLIVEFVKISHHGSLNNTSQDLLNLIRCNNFLISTNGGTAQHRHPSRETIARLVYNSNRLKDAELKIYFNYDLVSIKNRIGDFINENDLAEGNWSVEQKNSFYI